MLGKEKKTLDGIKVMVDKSFKSAIFLNVHELFLNVGYTNRPEIISDVVLTNNISWAISDSSGLEGPLEFKGVQSVILTGPCFEVHYNWVSGELL